FDTLQAIVNNDRPRVSDFRTDVPLAVEEVIERALRPRREERFASAREMAEALTRALAPQGGPATTGELADIIRRDCAAELEDERTRIDRAAEYLRELTGRGAEPPELSSRRARPVVETEMDVRFARKATSPFEGGLGGADTSASTSAGVVVVPAPEAGLEEGAAERGAARRRRWMVVAALALVAAIGVSIGIVVAGGGEGAKEDGAGAAAAAPAAAPTEIASAAAAPAGTAPAAEAANAPEAETAPAAEAETAPGADAENAPEAEADPAAAGEAAGATETAGEAAGAGEDAAGDEDAGGAGGGRGQVEEDSAADGERRASDGRRGSRPAKQSSKPAVKPTGPGYFSIDTMPYSQVYIDGELAGITPLVRVPLRPGKHSIRVVTQDGTQRRLSIKVQAGKTVTRRFAIEE